MNPITAFLAFVCVLAGLAVGNWVNLSLAFVFFAAAVVIALALTRDTVPVNVDAIIFWHVHDSEKTALAITGYREAIDRVAQTSLREMIGSSMLAALLSDRKDADERLKAESGAKTAPVYTVYVRKATWPSKAKSVPMRPGSHLSATATHKLMSFPSYTNRQSRNRSPTEQCRRVGLSPSSREIWLMGC